METVRNGFFLVTYINDLIGKDVYDAGGAVIGFRVREVAPMEMGVSVKVITRLRYMQKPVDGFQPAMCLTILIVYAKRGRMCDQDIQRPPVVHAVQHQARQYTECSQVRLTLIVLICSIRAVADGATKAADQKLFETYQLQVQV